MAYDRYVAISNPLHYTLIMSRQRCKQLMAGVYGVGFFDATINICFSLRLSFCSSNVIKHFFCDTPPLLALSCSDTRISEILMFASICYTVVISVVIILLSYVCIISTILQIRSTKGRQKAFSTCTCHLTTVAMFHGSQLFMYLRPASSYSMDTDKIASVFYALVIPMLNPLVYSLRNREVNDALQKAICKPVASS
nr:olfactory receptor 5B12-like [Pelodiscus sinensis]|eukprot:XP_006136587.2 olfactory receptor 5B12-like [Pelodiscus sinensis]